MVKLTSVAVLFIFLGALLESRGAVSEECIMGIRHSLTWVVLFVGIWLLGYFSHKEGICLNK